MSQEYFTVELASAIHLGVPLENMGTVVQFEAQNICTVPGVANFWYGVVNFKGSLLWVLDTNHFLNLSIQRSKPTQKLTAVILNSEESSSQKKVAIVTQKLKGILTLEASALKPIADNVSPQLRKCCTAIAQTESQTTYIIEPASLWQELHQQSILVSA